MDWFGRCRSYSRTTCCSILLFFLINSVGLQRNCETARYSSFAELQKCPYQVTYKLYICTQGPKTRRLLFLTFYLIILLTAKYFLQYKNILFITEVILV